MAAKLLTFAYRRTAHERLRSGFSAIFRRRTRRPAAGTAAARAQHPALLQWPAAGVGVLPRRLLRGLFSHALAARDLATESLGISAPTRPASARCAVCVARILLA